MVEIWREVAVWKRSLKSNRKDGQISRLRVGKEHVGCVFRMVLFRNCDCDCLPVDVENVVEEGGVRIYGGGRKICQEFENLSDGNAAGFIEASDPPGSSPRDSPL